MKATILWTVAALVGACSSSTNERSSLDERQERIQDQRAEAHDRSAGPSVPGAVDDDIDNDRDDVADSDRDRVVDTNRDGLADKDRDGISDADEDNEVAEPDNTDRNERDQNSATLTPLDQSNSSSDIEITQAIRKKVIGNDDLSFNAKNVKIVTVAGKVTLRGPVASPEEKSAIESSARAVPGVARVDNQLEVKR